MRMFYPPTGKRRNVKKGTPEQVKYKQALRASRAECHRKHYWGYDPTMESGNRLTFTPKPPA